MFPWDMTDTRDDIPAFYAFIPMFPMPRIIIHGYQRKLKLPSCYKTEALAESVSQSLSNI